MHTYAINTLVYLGVGVADFHQTTNEPILTSGCDPRHGPLMDIKNTSGLVEFPQSFRTVVGCQMIHS